MFMMGSMYLIAGLGATWLLSLIKNILEPYKYSGLRYRKDFQVVKLVKNPDGGDAFYLVSTY